MRVVVKGESVPWILTRSAITRVHWEKEGNIEQAWIDPPLRNGLETFETKKSKLRFLELILTGERQFSLTF